MYEHIIVVGSGKTSRANIEALIDDYIYANPKVKFTLYSTQGLLSEGQAWLKTYLTDKEITYGSESLLEITPETKTAMFILWDDEDPESANCLAIAKERNIPAFDLTDGLVAITPTDGLVVVEAPTIPEKERLSEDVPEVIDEDEDDEYEDPLYEAIHIIAGIFAEAIATELQKVLKK
jgi:hypothetical protein